MPTISITSHDGKLTLHPRFWKCQPPIRTITNTRYVSNKPAHLRVRPRSGIDDHNPDIELVETGLMGPDSSEGKFELPFKRTNSSSTAAMPRSIPTKASATLSYLPDWQRVATSESDFGRAKTTKSLEEERVLS